MFDVDFSHSSATPLPASVSIDSAIKLLHDFETIIKLNPDCKGCRPIPPPTAKNGFPRKNGVKNPENIQYYEVEDDLPFMPKKLWSGGVKYTADFLETDDGCDITVHAPGGFTSTNHWRILRDSIPEDQEIALERTVSKDLLHADIGPGHSGWYVSIVSDARCSRTFVGIVKGFLKNSHVQLQQAFIEKAKQTPAQQRSRRPTLGRRRSSEF